MDAVSTENQRDLLLSRREKRWSMNSQRLEEILAELMRPIGDARRSFDTDIIGLLEDYLTEAGLHALEADAEAPVAAPNYAELALLLQQTALIYGRKVDFLYQHVVDVSEALHASALFEDAAQASADDSGVADEAARVRSPRAAAPRAPAFARTGSQRTAARAAREAVARPHPTLPRVFMELEPRALNDARLALRDYAGDLIGLLDDFHAAADLSHSRMLVEDEAAATTHESSRSLRPISLVELQQAIEAAAPPLRAASPAPSPPPRASTPLPDTSTASDADSAVALDCTAELAAAPPQRRERKRRHSAADLQDVLEAVTVRFVFNADLRRHLAEIREFSIPTMWIKRVVKKRASDILSERRRLQPGACEEFPGWSAQTAGECASPDSDGDDGFFEQSSEASAEEAWRAHVLARAAQAQARAPDVRAQARRVLRALPSAARVPCDDVLRAAAHSDAHVSHVLLSTLFLANSGNVRILPGPPLSLNSFSLELLSTDERLYCAAASDEQQFQR